MKNEKFYLLSCGKWLNRSQFLDYFERKVLYTMRKYNLDCNGMIKDKREKAKVLKYFLDNKLNKYKNPKEKQKKAIILADSLDDMAYAIIDAFAKKDINELKKLLPCFSKSNKKFVRLFYLITDKEIELYAQLKKIKLKKPEKDKKQSDIALWLDEFEKKHIELKNSIVNSVLKIYQKI